MTNALAYYETEFITCVKGFIVEPQNCNLQCYRIYYTRKKFYITGLVLYNFLWYNLKMLVLDPPFQPRLMFAREASAYAMEQCFKNVSIYLNTNIYSYLETSGGQNSNMYLNVVHFFNTIHQWQLKNVVFLHWCLIHSFYWSSFQVFHSMPGY
jgi:hypothetical protein